MAERLVDLIKELGSTSELKSALITKLDSDTISLTNSVNICIKAIWSCRNFSTSEKDSLYSQYIYNNQSLKTLELPSTIQDKRIVLSAVSPCSFKTANLFQNDECCFVSITSQGKTTNINLKDKDLHGKVYADAELSSFCWSDDSKYLAFVAEKHRPKQSNWMDKRSEKDLWGEKHAYLDDWGEQMTGQSESVIVVLDYQSEDIKVLELPTGVCAGQVIWTPKGSLVGVAFVTVPYRLGLIYCRNRESFLFHIKLDQHYTKLTEPNCHVHSPRFSPDGSKLVFLESPAGGPHVRSAQLRQMFWTDKQVHTVVDHISTSVEIEGGQQFFGLSGRTNLPCRCWSDDSKFVVLSTPSNFSETLYVVDTETKEIFALTSGGTSCTALDVIANNILLSRSSFTQPTSLGLFVNFSQLKTPSEPRLVSSKCSIDGITEVKEDCWTFINSNHHSSLDVSNLPIPVLYIGPVTPNLADSKRRPLIVWVHGGPHSSIGNTFILGALFFIKLGYSVIFPNYRGSLGQGKNSLESLPGHCGTMDVEDVYQATLQSLERYKSVLDPDRVVLFGGSHGGFLVTHLSAKFPEIYKVVSARNPVIDIASMTVTTDITDWNFVESGQSYEIGKAPTGEVMNAMFQMSPLSVVNQVKAPTLLLLGKNDRRVPMSQGIFYHKMLLARDIPTKAYVYDDAHPLSKVDVETDCLIQTAIWFDQHLHLTK